MTGRWLRLTAAGFDNATALLLAAAFYDVVAWAPVVEPWAVAA